MSTIHTEPTIVTLPNSLRNRLEQIQSQFENDPTALARESVRAISALTTSSPEAAALLVAGITGSRSFETETVERVDNYHWEDITFLGIKVGRRIVNTPKITKKIVKGKLS